MTKLAMCSLAFVIAASSPAAAEMCVLAPAEGATAEGKLVLSDGAFILEIADAICLPGDEEFDRVGPTVRIHLSPEDAKVEAALKLNAGRSISVRGSMVAMHAAQHKAPIVMTAEEVTVK